MAPTNNELMAQIHPLRDMADRVEREVDHFAETLDKFNHVLHGQDAYQGAYDLAVEYKAFANSVAQRMKKRQETQRLHDMKNEFGKRLAQSRGPEDTQSLSSPSSFDERKQWQAEADTWELFRIMLELRYNPQRGEIQQERKDRAKNMGQPNRYTPDSALWERFVLKDDKAQERHLIVKWLQGTAENGESDAEATNEELESKAGRGSGFWVNGWMETREKIKGAKRARFMSTAAPAQLDIYRSDSRDPLVTELDPDAPSRQHRMLEKADTFSERSLWVACYNMLRRGKSWDEICQWCSERNQSWRAVSLGACAHDTHDVPLPGLFAGAVWRHLCYQIAVRGDTDDYEAAAYGLLSGHHDSVKAVSKSWDDRLYAFYNSALLQSFDHHLQKRAAALGRTAQQLNKHTHASDPSLYDADVKQFVKNLFYDESIASEAMRPIKLLQGSLVADTFDQLCVNLSQAISDAAWSQSPSTVITQIIMPPSPGTLLERVIPDDVDALRIVTHMVIMLRHVYTPFSDPSTEIEQHFDNILAAYIQYLNATKKRELAPVYAANMSIPRARASMALVLSEEHDIQEKLSLFNLMGLYEIDPISVLVEQSQQLIRTLPPRAKPDTALLRIIEPSADVVHPGQRIKLNFTSESDGGRGIADHLIVFHFVEGHWDITFGTLAYACRKLLLNGCFVEASNLVHRLPFESLSTVKSRTVLEKGINVMDREEVHLLVGDVGRLLDEGEEDKSEQEATLKVLQKQSQAYYELSLLVRAIDALGAWRQMEYDHISQIPPPTSAPSKLKRAFEETCAAVDLALDGTLLFAKDDTEASELAQLRSQLFPEIVLAYNATLCAGAHIISRDNLMRSMELAATVADTRTGLADAIMKAGRMKEVVTSFARASETMLKLNEFGKVRREKRHKTGGNLAVWEIGG